MDLTVVMPCLNEAATVGTCVQGALVFIATAGISGEVLVADNGSNDGSCALAEAAGARVITVRQRGYGHAVMAGVHAASTQFVAMGDCDGSYDFGTLGPFVDDLRTGAQLVMGNRFAGGIERGAMPALHRYLGSPLLNAAGHRLCGTRVGDLNCGLRAFDRQAILRLGLTSGGMEFASEMVARAARRGYDIRERPTSLARDGRGGRASHLRPWRDGLRHLRLMVRLRQERPTSSRVAATSATAIAIAAEVQHEEKAAQ